MMLPSRLGCPLSLKTPNMGNPGSVILGVGSSTVVPGSVGSYRPVIAGAKLREGKPTILPRGRALQAVGLSSMRIHPIGRARRRQRPTRRMDNLHRLT